MLSPQIQNAPFFFQVVFRDGNLDVRLFEKITRSRQEQWHPYRIGDDIDITRWYPGRKRQIAEWIQRMLEQSTDIEHTLVVDSKTLQKRDIEIAKIDFEYCSIGMKFTLRVSPYSHNRTLNRAHLNILK